LLNFPCGLAMSRRVRPYGFHAIFRRLRRAALREAPCCLPFAKACRLTRP